MTYTDMQLAMRLTQTHEGLRLLPYQDQRHQLTIGYGRNLSAKGITEAEACWLFGNDWNDALKSAQTFSWFSTLDPVRQAVVIDMIFNLGLTRFQLFIHAITAIAEHRWIDARDMLLDSLAAKQDVNRYQRLAKMIETGEWPK